MPFILQHIALFCLQFSHLITHFVVGKQLGLHKFDLILNCFWSDSAHILVGTHLRYIFYKLKTEI